MERRKKNKLVQPFLKWAGGKRQLLPEIRNSLPNPRSYGRYFEPFLGGGAVFFDLQPKKAVINDFNAEAINVYRIIRDDVDGLIEHLKTHENEADYFYRIREMDRNPNFDELSVLTKASRIIYLNKTCYNGLFRVNSQGQFNVPFGRYKNPNIVNEIVLRAVSRYLNDNKIEILNTDFEKSLESVKKNDFVYFDPPYDPVSDSSSFTGYTLNGFDKEEQERLRNLCDKLNDKGCKFLLSNSATPFILGIYKDYEIEIVEAARAINSVASGRGKIDEVLIKNYD